MELPKQFHALQYAKILYDIEDISNGLDGEKLIVFVPNGHAAASLAHGFKYITRNHTKEYRLLFAKPKDEQAFVSTFKDNQTINDL